MALTDNLLAFYKLDNTNDSSGNNRTLTNNGNVSFASGKIGNAAVFDGTNYLTLNTNSNLNFATGITFSGWLKQTDISEIENKFFGLIPQSGEFFYASILNSYSNGQYNGQVFADFGHGLDNFALNENNSARLQLDTWGFVAIVVDNTNWSLWINDYKVTFPTPATINSEAINEIIIGAGSQGPYDQPFNGSIDAVGIWNRALSDSEVASLYNSGTGLELPAAPAVKNGWIDNIFWINDVATSLDQNGDGKWQGKLYEGGTLFSGTKYSLTFVDGLAQPENIVTVIGNSVPVAFGLNEAEEPLVELVFASITSAGETVVEQIVPTVLPTGYTVAETVLAYSIDTTATFEGSINVDFILPSNISQAVFDRVKGFHVKNNGTIEEMARVSSDFSTKRITVAITSFSDFLFLDEPQNNKSVKVVGKSKFVGKVKFA